MSAAALFMLLARTQTMITAATGTVINLNMNGGGGASAAFDGTTNQDAASGAATTASGASVSGYNNALGKNWGAGVLRVITRFTIYGPNNNNILAGGGGTTFKLQGSNDNSSWTDLTSALSFPTGIGQSVDTTTGMATSAWQYHRVNFNGNGTNTMFVAEIQFFATK